MSRRIRCVRHVAHMCQKMNACRILMGNSEGNNQLGSPRCKLEDNIKIDLGGIACGSMKWTLLDQDRDQGSTLVNTVLILRVA
jgi:hypothetical protein